MVLLRAELTYFSWKVGQGSAVQIVSHTELLTAFISFSLGSFTSNRIKCMCSAQNPIKSEKYLRSQSFFLILRNKVVAK